MISSNQIDSNSMTPRTDAATYSTKDIMGHIIKVVHPDSMARLETELISLQKLADFRASQLDEIWEAIDYQPDDVPGIVATVKRHMAELASLRRQVAAWVINQYDDCDPSWKCRAFYDLLGFAGFYIPDPEYCYANETLSDLLRNSQTANERDTGGDDSRAGSETKTTTDLSQKDDKNVN